MATEEQAESQTPPEETEKYLIPPEEKAKFEINKLILNILGYNTLVFVGLSLFFPYWNDYTSTYQFISLWQRTLPDGTILFHWDILWNWQLYGIEIVLSIHQIGFLIAFIGILVNHVWKRSFPGIKFFWYSIFLAIPVAFGFPLTFGFSFDGPLTPLYGPTWGLAFGWWALLIAGILGMARQYYSDMLKRKKSEPEQV